MKVFEGGWCLETKKPDVWGRVVLFGRECLETKKTRSEESGKMGEQWDSNPRPSEPQSDALTY